MVTKTNKECGNAWRIEEIAIEKGLKNLLSTSVRIVEAVLDDKGVIDTILACMRITSQKDLWHKAKKLMAKFVKELYKNKFNTHDQLDNVFFEFDLTWVINATMQGWLIKLEVDCFGCHSQLVARCVQVLEFELGSKCDNSTFINLKFTKLA
jgi:hypothetical protein